MNFSTTPLFFPTVFNIFPDFSTDLCFYILFLNFDGLNKCLNGKIINQSFMIIHDYPVDIYQ